MTKILKLLTFSVGNLNLALPIESVQKVMNYTPVYSSGLNSVGVAHIDNREITVIDLHKRLFKISQTMPSESGGYLIVIKNPSGDPLAILVDKTPTLLDVPISEIRTLPESYRRADTLEIASHVTVIPHQDKSLTIFLLDREQLISNHCLSP
jgi:purine-binding chemotaxis protein CheW